MKQITLPMEELQAVAATRFAFGIGVGLLLAHCLPERHRRWAAWTLVAIGAASTPPLLYDVIQRARHDG